MCDNWNQKWRDIPFSCIECPIRCVRMNCLKKSFLDEWKWHGKILVGARQNNPRKSWENTGILDHLCKATTCSVEGLKRLLLSPQFNCHVTKNPLERISTLKVPLSDFNTRNDEFDQHGNKVFSRFVKFLMFTLKRKERSDRSRMHAILLEKYFNELSRLYWSVVTPVENKNMQSMQNLSNLSNLSNLVNLSNMPNIQKINLRNKLAVDQKTHNKSNVFGSEHIRAHSSYHNIKPLHHRHHHHRSRTLSRRSSTDSKASKYSVEENESFSTNFLPVLYHMPFNRELPPTYLKRELTEDQVLRKSEDDRRLSDFPNLKRATMSIMALAKPAPVRHSRNFSHHHGAIVNRLARSDI